MSFTLPNSTAIPSPMRHVPSAPQPKQVPAFRATGTHDTVRFSGGDENMETVSDASAKPSFLKKAGHALKAAGKSLLDGKFWMEQAAISGAITLATCWLPGSQLITIPVWLSVAGAYKAVTSGIHAFKNPNEKTDPSKEPSDSNSEASQFSKADRAKAAGMAAWQQVKSDFKERFVRNALFSGGITLATCWLPGSQLVTIPVWYCMDSAISAYQGSKRGWNNPGELLNKPKTQEAQSPTTPEAQPDVTV